MKRVFSVSSLLLFFTALITASVVPTQSSPHNKLIDLSHNLNSETLHWITVRPFELRVTQNGTIRVGDDEFWAQGEEILMAAHTATHVDAPCHFALGKWCVSDIPFDHLIDRPLAVVDVSQNCLENRDYEASVDDVKEWEQTNGKIPEKAVLVIRTGWSRWWPNKKNYFGTEGTDESQLHFPGVHPELAQWLVENRDIVGLGVDCASVDNGQSKTYKTHRILASRNIYNIENFAESVFHLPPIGAKMIALPLKLDGASGTPVTIVAYLDSDSDHTHSDAIELRKSSSFMLSIISLLVCILLLS